MAKLKGFMGSLVVFFVLIVLVVNFWADFRVDYNITDEENLKEGLTIFEQLETLELIQGINELKSGIEKLTSIGSADFDILGGLATSANGVLQTVGGLVTFLPRIMTIAFDQQSGYYPTLIPPIITKLLGLIVIIGFAVLLISAKLGFDFT